MVSAATPAGFLIPASTIETLDVFFDREGNHRKLMTFSRGVSLVMASSVDIAGPVSISLGSNTVTFTAPGTGSVKSSSMKGVRSLHAGGAITVRCENLVESSYLRLYFKYDN